MATNTDDPAEIRKAFRDAVNMTAKQLEAWLKTDESQEVGWTRCADGSGESIGHEMGRHIVRLIDKRGDYTDTDLAHMRKVVGYVARHKAQRPHKADVEHTRWAYSLKNWGHDPERN